MLDELAQAQAEIQGGRPAEALARLDALTEGGAHVALQRAAAALASGDPVRAEREAQAVLDAEPARTDARILVARALEAQGRVEASDRALAGLPSEVAPANDLAWSLARLGRDLDRALTLAEAAVERGGDDPALLDTLATVQLARGDAQAARATLARALPAARGPTREHLLERERQLGNHEAP